LYKIVRRPPYWNSAARLARHTRLDSLDWLDWLDKVERVELSRVESSRAKWNLSYTDVLSSRGVCVTMTSSPTACCAA